MNQIQNNNQEEEIKVNEDCSSKNTNIMHINSKNEFQSKDKNNEQKKLIYHKKTLNSLCKINKKSKSKDKIKGINDINTKNETEENASIKNNNLNSDLSDYFNEISKFLKIKEKNKIMNFNELTLIEYLNEQIKNMKYNKNNIKKENNETNINDKDKEMKKNKDIYKGINNNSEETKVNTLDMNNLIINDTPNSYRENKHEIKNSKLNTHFFLKNSQRYITYKNFLNNTNSNKKYNYNYNYNFSNNKKSNKIELKNSSKNKIKIDKSKFLKKSLSKPKLSKKISLISLDNKYLEHNLSFSKHIKTNNSYRMNKTKRNCIPKNLLRISFNKNNSNGLNNSSNLYLKNRNKRERITEYYNYSNKSIKNLNKKNKIYYLRKNNTSEKSFNNISNGRTNSKNRKSKKNIDLSRSNSNKKSNKENSNDKPLFYVQIDLSKLMNETSAQKKKTNKKYEFSKSNKNMGYKNININDFKNDFIIIPKKYDNK